MPCRKAAAGNTDDSRVNLSFYAGCKYRPHPRESAMRTLTYLLLLLLWMTPALAQTPAEEIAEVNADPVWDPLRANKSMEVGTFYFKRKNYDAAIDRFEEAARLQPNLARPHLKLGETWEKKRDWPKAVAAYRKYLELYRTAPDGNKIRKRIEGLERQIAREAAVRSRQ